MSTKERELEIIASIAQALNASTEVEAALATVLALTAAHLNLRTGWVFLFDARTGAPYLAAAQELPPGLAADPSRMTGPCTCLDSLLKGALAQSGSQNIVTCSRLKWLGGKGTAGLRFHASTPIHSRGRELGVLNVASAEWRELSADDLRLLRVIGDMLGVAVERSQLYAASLETGAIEERNRLAREIHDTVAQGLAAAALRLETIDALLAAGAPHEPIKAHAVEALTLTRRNLDEIRRSVLDLRAAPLEGRTLGEAIAAMASDAADGRPRVLVEIVGSDRSLSRRLEAGLFRIAQETVGNAIRHAAPKTVSLRLTFRPSEVALEVWDDGRGFTMEAQARGRFGLVGVSERVDLLGGTLEVRSEAGAGTRIAVTVPLNSVVSAA